MRGKIGVYGRSLGGIATTHLTKYVDMVIVDRSFGNLHEVARTKFFGQVTVDLFKYATGGWRASSDKDILSTVRDLRFGCLPKPCYKVITCDKNDEIIDLHASLMVTAAKHFCSKNPELLSPQEIDGFLKAIWSILKAEERLFKYISLRVS